MTLSRRESDSSFSSRVRSRSSGSPPTSDSSDIVSLSSECFEEVLCVLGVRNIALSDELQFLADLIEPVETIVVVIWGRVHGQSP
ncbi:hypothetical protein [Haloarcula onubensis]|uniref:hypothetical protein n=1 Tax=Haloarcula onubensis TaxID=2950539 RepID=UPI003AAEACB1